MGESSSTKVFSEDEGKLISEYSSFMEEGGRDVIRNKWVVFLRVSSFKGHTPRQISEKLKRLETKFLKLKINSSSPPNDPPQPHIFRLCESLWGKPKTPPTPDQSSTLPNQSLQLRELYLFCENKSLRLKECQLESEKLESQSSIKKRKVTAPAPVALNEDNGDRQSFCGAEKDDDEVEKTLSADRLIIEDLVVGNNNKRSATKGGKVKVHFTAKVKGSDEAFESTRDQDPAIVCLGSEDMIEGFTNGIEGMHVGGKRRLTIPPSLGYGDEGYGEIVPPNSWLEYEVLLVSVKCPNSDSKEIL